MKTKIVKTVCAMLACVLMVSATACGKQEAEEKVPVVTIKPVEPAKPQEPEKPVHEHSWTPVTVHHDETGHYDVQYGERKIVKYHCGQNFYDLPSLEAHETQCEWGTSVETTLLTMI